MAFILVASALIIVLSKRREEVHRTDTANVTALKGLLGTRDLELAESGKDLETMTSEYKALAQIDIKEIVKGWLAHTASRYYVENAALKGENEELRARLARWEKV